MIFKSLSTKPRDPNEMELPLHLAIIFSLRGSRRTMFDGGDHLAGVAAVGVDVGTRGETVKIR